MKPEIIYLNMQAKIETDKDVITIADIGKITCGSVFLKAKIQALPVLQAPDLNAASCVISVMKIIEIITTSFPLTIVVNTGENTVLVLFSISKQRSRFLDLLLTSFVCLISFFGTAFTIMAFHNDINISALFSYVYETITGAPAEGFTILEISYSIGLSVGILVFFNHFGGRRFTKDPTPVEVEMRSYENEILTTLATDSEREGNIIDVD